MSRIIAIVCAVVCALTIAPPVPAHAADGDPVRILIVGDSLTLGRHGMFTWRYRLDQEFRRQGVGFDFVGSLTTPHPDPGYPTSRYLDPNFDQNHMAKAGWWLRDAVGSFGPEVTKHNPDVVIFQMGAADVVYGDSPEVTANRLRVAVDEMQAAKPNVRIVLPQVLTRERPDPTINPRTLAYNDLLPDVAAEKSTAESPVTVANVMAGWSPQPPLTFDASHLSPTGEAFYAQRIAEHLHGMGVLPGVPNAYHGQYIAWPRTERLNLRTTAGRIYGSWARQAVSNGRVRWRQVGSTAWRTSGLYPKGTVTIPVPTGRSYDVQLQINYYGLTGPWGQSVRATVPRLARPAAPARVTVTRAGVRWAKVHGATSYVVRIRKIHSRRWLVRRTAAGYVTAPRVAVARVRAVGPSGVSPWRRGVR